jgi:hypothetical protein
MAETASRIALRTSATSRPRHQYSPTAKPAIRHPTTIQLLRRAAYELVTGSCVPHGACGRVSRPRRDRMTTTPTISKTSGRRNTSLPSPRVSCG